MAKVRFGIDQVTAWVLAVVVGGAVFGAGYFATKLGAQGDDDGHVVDERATASAEDVLAADGFVPAEAPASEAAAVPEPSSPAPGGHDGDLSGIQWTYTGSTGPDHWGTLAPAFKACDAGKRQSPVDIDAVAANAKLLPLRFFYKTADMLIKNDGHTLIGTAPQGNYIEVEGERFDLTQFHFHAPSEHKVSGIPYDLEMHLYHQNVDGQTAVVSVLFEEGKENRALGKLWSIMPTRPGSYDEPLAIDPNGFLPERRLYYHYVGSMTTPPCTEGVRWYVLTQPVHVSPKQVDQFVGVVKFNARPVQPLGARRVQKSTR